MKKLLSVVLALCSLGFALQVHAIEGGCKMFDVVGVDFSSSDDADSVGGRISGEVGVDAASEAWSIVAGADWKSVSLDWSREDAEALGGDLGVKYYLTRMTGCSVFGRYEEFDIFGFADVASVNLLLEQRFLLARSGVSPYARLQGAIRFKDFDPSTNNEGDAGEDFMGKAVLGSDFMLTETLAMTFEGGYQFITDAVAAEDNSSGALVAGVSFKGYFD